MMLGAEIGVVPRRQSHSGNAYRPLSTIRTCHLPLGHFLTDLQARAGRLATLSLALAHDEVDLRPGPMLRVRPGPLPDHPTLPNSWGESFLDRADLAETLNNESPGHPKRRPSYLWNSAGQAAAEITGDEGRRRDEVGRGDLSREDDLSVGLQRDSFCVGVCPARNRGADGSLRSEVLIEPTAAVVASKRETRPIARSLGARTQNLPVRLERKVCEVRVSRIGERCRQRAAVPKRLVERTVGVVTGKRKLASRVVVPRAGGDDLAVLLYSDRGRGVGTRTKIGRDDATGSKRRIERTIRAVTLDCEAVLSDPSSDDPPVGLERDIERELVRRPWFGRNDPGPPEARVERAGLRLRLTRSGRERDE